MQALVRVRMSAVTSLFGVVLMQTSALDVLQPQRGTAILARATLLDPARDKNEPATRELKAGAAGA